MGQEKEKTQDAKITKEKSSILEWLEYYDMLLVACFWKEPTLFQDYEKIIHFDRKQNDLLVERNSLLTDNRARVLYNIGEDLILGEQVKELSPLAVNTYLEKHKKLQAVWKSISKDPYQSITEFSKHANIKNVESYLLQIKKYKSLLELQARFNVTFSATELSIYNDLSIDEIYNMYENRLQESFLSREEGTQAYPLMYNIENNLLSWNQGDAMGLSYYGLPEFSKFTGGIANGGITLIGGVSNVGKSSFLRNVVFPTFFLNKDIDPQTKKEISHKAVIFLNEEDIEKWQREFLTWVGNNYNHDDFTKTIFRDGAFMGGQTDRMVEIDRAIRRAHKLLGDNKGTLSEDILFVPLPKFSTQIVIKQMKRYSALGYKNFIIDTFKMDNTDDAKIDNNTRLQLIQNMTNIYNVCKKDVKNLRVICTVQLSKASSYKRILSQDDLAESKNMIDVCSSGIFMRPVWEDEKDEFLMDMDGNETKHKNSRFLKVCDFSGVRYKLEKGKKYLLLFTVKSREGVAGVGADVFVVEVDWARNIVREIGTTTVPEVSA